MKKNTPLLTFPFIAATSLLTACGGGGSTTTTATADPATADVVSTGVITGFGSVYVNGVRYDTRRTRLIYADDNSVLVSNPSNDQLRQYLGLGQVINLEGTADDDGSNGVATAIYMDNELVGPVTASSVSSAEGTFEVLGQTVAVTPDTIIDDSIIERALGGASVADDLRFADIATTTGQSLALEQLVSDGMLLEVNGFVSEQQLLATRIEDVNNRDRISPTTELSNSGEIELKGFVQNLATGQFTLNGLIVFYDDADLDSEDFGSGGLSEGQFVEVKGTPLSSTSVEAREIEREDDFRGGAGLPSNDSRLEIEGVITSLQADAAGSGGVAVINGIEIRLNDLSQLSVGMHVEIKGQLQDGVLLLNRVQEESEDTVRVEDHVVGVSGNRISTRLGLQISVSERTRVEGNLTGSRIKARGFPLNGDVVWSRLEMENGSDDSDCKLRGPVDQITGTSEADFGLMIQGIAVNLDQISSNSNFQRSDNVSLGRQGFYAQLEQGDVVEVKSVSNGCAAGSLVAREVEFEETGAFSQSTSSSTSTSDSSEITGSVSSVTSGGFVINGATVQVNDATLIDDSIIEAVRGVEVNDEQALGTLAETLSQLLPVGFAVEVSITRSTDGILATRIEDL